MLDIITVTHIGVSSPVKYVLQDYVFRKPYKEIEFQGEFALN
jgi:hypothetical protein